MEGEGVAACDAHHQPEVRPDETVLGGGSGGYGLAQLAAARRVEAGAGLTATLDRLRQLALLICGEQGHEADSLRY